MDNIKNILCTSGFSGIWYSQSFSNSKWLKESLSQKLKDLFIQKWHSDLDQTSTSNFYKIIKTKFGRSDFITHLPNHLSKGLFQFKSRNHKLPIEVGRWNGIPSNERLCPNCRELGDEYHYILTCPIFTKYRRNYIKTFYYRRPNIEKLRDLFNTEISTDITNLSIFCNIIVKYFKT